MVSPLQNFLTSKQAGFDVQQRQIGLESLRQQAPLDLGLKQSNIKRQEQAIDSSSREKTLQGAQVMNQFLKRVKSIPDVNQRLALFNQARPTLQKFGIDLPPNISAENVTDEGLIPLETGIGETVQQLTSQERGRADLVRRLKSDDPVVRAAAERESGAATRAGTTTVQERLAQDEGLTGKVAESQRTIKTQEELGKGEAATTTKQINQGLEAVDKTVSNIRNLDRAIDLLDKGANTGALQQFLPTITAASRELGQVQKELGLDIIGSVTFGALSQGELDLALSTALDLGQSPEALRDVLTRKKDAQNKLINYLDDQIEFLSQGGTVPQWRAIVRRKGREGGTQESAQASSDGQRQGGQVMIDANGNRAMVFPDGSFEEL